MQPSLFPDDRPEQAARLAPKLKALAEQGIYFGTSSWKYEGWLGSIYTPERYTTRGKFSRRKFEDECLAEYAETFPAVGGDFSFYQFPAPEYWRKLFDSSPQSLLFGLKVPEDISVVGFDDIRVAQFITPALTTVNEPDIEHGQLAAELLIDLIRGETPAQRQIMLETRLIVRESCGGYLQGN